MLQNSLDDFVCRTPIGRIAISRCPFASRMKGIPRRTLVASRLMAVAMLPEAKTNSRF